MNLRIRIVKENDENELPRLLSSYRHQLRSSRNQTVIYEKKSNANDMESSHKILTPIPIVQVVALDTLHAAKSLVNEGFNPLVLNMASDYQPGGGYRKGSLAQEEELFRRTTLSLNLEELKNSYPLKSNQAIFTPSILCFRNDSLNNYKLIDENDCFWFDVLSIPAVRKPPLTKDKQHYENQRDRDLMMEKIRTIFTVAHEMKHRAVVVSALGCGAFRNPPVEVASLFKQVLGEFGNNCPDRVVFAILDQNPDHPNSNFSIFSKVLLS